MLTSLRSIYKTCDSCSESASLQIHAEKSPFLTEKLRVFMLPTLACVKKEKTVDYVVGFDELGGSDDFSTHTLAARLSLHGLITYEGTEDYGGPNPHQQQTKGAKVGCTGLHKHACEAKFDRPMLPAGVQRSVRQSTADFVGSDDEDSDFE